MLRTIILFFVASCTMGTLKRGGLDSYLYDHKKDYTLKELNELAPQIIQTSFREPMVGKQIQLFNQGQKPLKRVGLVIFESEIQPTREGLSKNNFVYLNEAGKQLLTENLLSIFEESMRGLAPEIEFLSGKSFISSKSFTSYGVAEDDFVVGQRNQLSWDDIFYLPSGKKTTMTTILNPRGMRDMSFLLVPAFDLMGGPKWSEHNKHFLNDVAKEFNLDAVILAMSQLKWTAAHIDKHSGENIPEELSIKLKTAILVPLSRYHDRLEKIGVKDKPNITVCYRNYESDIKFPARISVPENDQTFETITNEILLPAFKTYKDLAQMTVLQMSNDLKATW
jgi:hypothetical protein